MSAVPDSRPTSTRRFGGGISLPQLYIGRATLAIFWAIAFASGDSRLSTGTKILVVAYPAIDVIASLVDARSERRLGSSEIQLVNAAVSLVALIALVIAVSSGTPTVLHVFGAWATVSGLIQLTVAVRRRSQFGRQTAMLISGGVSAFAGIFLNVMATATHPKVSNLAGYAILGAVLFIVSAVVLRRSQPAS